MMVAEAFLTVTKDGVVFGISREDFSDKAGP